MKLEISRGGGSTYAADGNYVHENVTLLWDGRLSIKPQFLIEGYLRTGELPYEKLDNGFVLCILDTREGLKGILVTDRINTYPVLVCKNKNTLCMSTSLHSDLVTREIGLSVEGLACYIANGNMLNGLTAFTGVRKLSAGTMLSFEDNDYRESTYSQTDILEPKFVHYEGAQNALRDAIAHTIEKFIEEYQDGRILISLSGGYDARGLLGLLKAFNFKGAVETFCYYSTPSIHDRSDANVSRKLAEELGLTHFSIQSNNYDLATWLFENFRTGELLAPLCDELSALRKLAQDTDAPYDCVVVGDEWFGRLAVPISRPQEILDSVSICGQSALAPLSRIRGLPLAEWSRSLDNLCASIMASAEHLDSGHDKKDFLYFNQRINYVLSSWRYYFTRELGRIESPYLSPEILQVMSAIPSSLRIEKSLFCRVIQDMTPNVWSQPIATDRRSLAGLPLGEMLLKSRVCLLKSIRRNSSLLDEYVPKDCIIQSLEEFNSAMIRRTSVAQAKQAVNFIRRKSPLLDSLAEPFLGSRVVKTPSYVQLLVRLIYLNLALSPENYAK